MRFRAAPLRTAAIVAAVFVAIACRLPHRVRRGIRWRHRCCWTCPASRSPGPFAHVALFGPVTTRRPLERRRQRAAVRRRHPRLRPAQRARRHAAALRARFDPRPARAVSRALVSRGRPRRRSHTRCAACAEPPHCAGSAGPAALLVPVFEQTVERALALAASMEVRGFAATRPAVAERREHRSRFEPRASPRPGRHRAPTSSISHSRPAASRSCRARPDRASRACSRDERALPALRGRPPAGASGRRARPRHNARRVTRAGFVGVVAQSVRLGSPPRRCTTRSASRSTTQGLAPQSSPRGSRQTADEPRHPRLLDRAVDRALRRRGDPRRDRRRRRHRPALLLVDEPLAELDDCGPATRVRHARPASRTSRARASSSPSTDRRVARDRRRLARDRRRTCRRSASPDRRRSARAPVRRPARRRSRGAGAAASARLGARPRRCGTATPSRFAMRSFTLHAGELVALTGANGAGKSSLLGAMAVPDAAGRVVDRRRRRRIARPGGATTCVALVPEQFDDLFFRTTVAAECHRADRRNRPATPTARDVRGAARPRPTRRGRCSLRHPRDLSAGERLCLAHRHPARALARGAARRRAGPRARRGGAARSSATRSSPSPIRASRAVRHARPRVRRALRRPRAPARSRHRFGGARTAAEVIA